MNKKEEEKLYHKAVDTKENLETENLRLEREVLEFQRDMLKRQKTEYDNYLRTKHKNHKNRNILLWSIIIISVVIVIIEILG